jgi:hypothetical protein
MAGGAPRHFNSLARQISECEGSTMEAQMTPFARTPQRSLFGIVVLPASHRTHRVAGAGL